MDIELIRAEILIKLNKGKTIQELTKEYKIPRKKIYEWQQTYTEQMTLFSQIKALIKKYELKEALRLCNIFPDFLPIISQKITILIKLKRYDEALALCDKYPLDEAI